MSLKTFTALLCLLQVIGLSTALDHVDHHHIHKRQSSTRYTGQLVPSYNMSMPVDHFNKADTKTYNNRYWVNDTYWKPGGPVFFYDEGELGIAEGRAAADLAEVNRTSAVVRLAEKYHGVAVLWEHRYYGLSLPIPLNRSTSEPQGGIPGYQYLTVEQALEDVVYFAKNFQPQGCAGNDCTSYSPSKVPWVWVGGSYPGIRGALMRIRNPEIFHAVWASSAPVEARYDGSVYFNPIEASLPSNCSNDVRAAVKYADQIMSGTYGAQAYVELQRLTFVAASTNRQLNASYNLNSSSSYSRYSIGQLMATPLTLEFLFEGPSKTTNIFCNIIQSYNPSGNPSITTDPYIAILSNPGGGAVTAKGIAATYNSSTALEAYFYAYRRYSQDYSNVFLNEQLRRVVQLPPDAMADINSWHYQILTEFGYLQASNPANITIVSKYYNTSALYPATEAQFSARNGSFPARPNTTAFTKYGGWNMNPSNVMFTDGEFDPWRSGTVMSGETWIGAPVRTVKQDVPQCGTPPDGNDVFGLIYPGEVHGPDLWQYPEEYYGKGSPLYDGLQLFSKALDTWLPCFKASPL